MESLAEKIEGGAINMWVIGDPWIWPIMEILHFLGLSILLGALLIIDLRMLGYFRGVDIRVTHALLPWVFVGFALNLVTGVLFFFGDPFRYAVHTGFQPERRVVLLETAPGHWHLGR